MFRDPAGNRRKLAAFAAMLLLLTGSLLSAADEALFPADFASAYTQKQYALETAAFNRATLGEAYRKLGSRDPRWDAAAEAFLDAVALHWASVTLPRQHPQPDWPGLPRVLELGDTAISLGCNDPLVLYCHARLMQEADRPLAWDRLMHAAQLLLATNYPPQRLYSAAVRLQDQILDQPTRDQQMQLIEDHALAMARGPFINAAHRRTVLIWLTEVIKGQEDTGAHVFALSPQRRQSLFSRLSSDKEADPWLAHVLSGDQQIDLAWKARGGGVAATVTRRGWNGFNEHLTEAKRHLAAAYALHPELPEAPARMISVAMGIGAEQAGGDEVQWFKRALAAQVDHQDAYERLFLALTPRWGGSHEQMLEIGILAARTGQYETEVPFQLITAIDRISSDRHQTGGGRWDLWHDPEIYALVGDVLTNYAQRLGRQRGGDWYRSCHAALAWRTGRLDEARKLLDLLGDGVDLAGFSRVDAPGDVAVAQTYGLTGPNREALSAAIAAHDAGRHPEALDAFRALAGKLPQDDKSRRYITDRIRSLDNRVRYDAGEWVDLLPPDLNELAGWHARSGAWAVETNDLPRGGGKRSVLATTAAATGALITSDLPLGARFEIVARVRIPEHTPNESRNRPCGGLVFGFDTFGRAIHRLLLEPHVSGKALLQTEGAVAQARLEASASSLFKLHVARWDARLQAAVDGQAIDAPRPLTDIPELVEPRVGFMLDAVGGQGKRLRVMQARARRLNAPPQPGAMALTSEDDSWVDRVPAVRRPKQPQSEPLSNALGRRAAPVGIGLAVFVLLLFALRSRRRAAR